jgi:hypothetical protein
MGQPANKQALARANAAANNNHGGNSVGNPKQACPLYDVIIIVAGTVDPVNNKGNEANSYDKGAHDVRHPQESQPDSNYYWTGNAKFVGKLLAFQTSHDHVMVFRDHGWNGDNSVGNRKIAGKAFVNWLCGVGRISALPAYKTRKVSFHLIGHSHGGNVINEMSLNIARNGAWPTDWKVKSVVYLSTPFFQTIHKPTTQKWHGAARICNVFCRYDLTQTAIADFSLRQLMRVTNVVANPANSFTNIIEKIVKFDYKCLFTLVTGLRPGWKWDWFNSGVEWHLDPTKARNMYERVLDLIKNIQLLFEQVKLVVSYLSKKVYPYITPEFEAQGLTVSRAILSPSMAAKINAEIEKVIAGTRPAAQALKARMDSNVYPGDGFYDDIHTEALIVPIINLLSIDPGSLRGTVPDLLFEAFKPLIEVFDDTLHTCNHLYKIPIVDVDVSYSDKFYNRREPAFAKFKAALIQAEMNYMGSQTKYNFVHMLFVLAAQLEAAHHPVTLAKWAAEALNAGLYANDPIAMWRGKTSFYARMKDLIQLIRNWYTVLDSRYTGGIEWTRTKAEYARDVREEAEEAAAVAAIDKMDNKVRLPVKKTPEELKAEQEAFDREPAYGSVPYLATVSHSVSRKELYPPVDTFLRAQFDSHVTPPKR